MWKELAKVEVSVLVCCPAERWAALVAVQNDARRGRLDSDGNLVSAEGAVTPWQELDALHRQGLIVWSNRDQVPAVSGVGWAALRAYVLTSEGDAHVDEG